jgi:Fe-S-cluster-containing hydrogenase component 2
VKKRLILSNSSERWVPLPWPSSNSPQAEARGQSVIGGRKDVRACTEQWWPKSLHEKLSQSLESGYSIDPDPEKCYNKGTFMATCHFGAIEMEDSGRMYTGDECLRPQLCMADCPSGAFSLYLDPYEPLAVEMESVRKDSAGTRDLVKS